MGPSSNFGNMLSMAVASLFLPFLPMLATQILLNNLLNDLSEVGIPFDNVRAAGIALQRLLDLQGQAGHPLAHIRRAGGDPHPYARSNGDHLSARKTAVTSAAPAVPAVLTRAPSPNSTTTAGAALATLAPGANAAASTASFWSSVNRRRRSGPINVEYVMLRY